MSQITTHILDTSRGTPAAGIGVALEYFADEHWRALASGVTNADGRIPNFLPAGQMLSAGTYRLVFGTAAYLQQHHQVVFYPTVQVVFNLPEGGAHHHIPLLLSPFGYSTYRGS